MAKMGRPKKDNAKLKHLGVRVSEEEYARLATYAAKHNQTITQVALEALDKQLRED